MKGIDIVRDTSGKIREIHLKADANPELFRDVSRLVNIRMRQEGAFESLSPKKTSLPMTTQRFRELIHESKASGELSETAFFQLNPAWLQKREELSSPNLPKHR